MFELKSSLSASLNNSAYILAAHSNRLMSRISKAQSEHEILSLEVAAIEGSIEEFLSEYKLNIGALVSRLKEINSEIEFYENRLGQKNKISLPEILKTLNILLENRKRKKNIFLEEAMDEEKKELRQELKNMYRRLSQINGDVYNPSENDAEFFNLINRFYNTKNNIVSAANSYLQDASANVCSYEEINNLETEYDSLLNQMDKLKINRYRLINSPEYMMMQKFSWAKLCGEDLSQQLKEMINIEIKERKKILLKKRTALSYLKEKSGDKVSA